MEEGLVIADIFQEEVSTVRESFRLKEDRKEALYHRIFSEN